MERIDHGGSDKMKEHPILFKGDMIKAILEDQKTMTRRIKGLNKINEDPEQWKLDALLPDGTAVFNRGNGHEIVKIKCPYGVPGDRLWVKEAWGVHARYDKLPPSKLPKKDRLQNGIWYLSDICRGEKSIWMGRTRSSRFMPRFASRITLEITNIRAERLQEITAEDAIKEGCRYWDCGHPDCGGKHYGPIGSFMELWNSIHGKDAWDRNDWVGRYEFKRIKP
jgi:hypothetical protein